MRRTWIQAEQPTLGLMGFWPRIVTRHGVEVCRVGAATADEAIDIARAAGHDLPSIDVERGYITAREAVSAHVWDEPDMVEGREIVRTTSLPSAHEWAREISVQTGRRIEVHVREELHGYVDGELAVDHYWVETRAALVHGGRHGAA